MKALFTRDNRGNTGILEVEGGTPEWFMQILRHECGHAIQHAYQLHRRREWQRLFGKSSTRYPSHYLPNPISKKYVQHLRLWYAQAHPDEDFAETFAVWLRPRSNWRSRYQGWPALKKLEYVDELMREIGPTPLPAASRRRPDRALHSLRITLREHYAETLRRWVANLDEHWSDAVELVGNRRARVWRLYMSGSINGFDDNGLQLYQTLGVKSVRRPTDLPATRRNWD